MCFQIVSCEKCSFTSQQISFSSNVLGNTDHCGNISVIFNIFWEQNIDDKFGSFGFVAEWAYETSCISELGELTYGQRYYWDQVI